MDSELRRFYDLIEKEKISKEEALKVLKDYNPDNKITYSDGRTELRLECGDDIEKAVIKLLYERACGNHVTCKFNTFELNSDTVTLNGAYKKILGKTKVQYDASVKKRIKRNERIMKELEDQAVERIPEQIKRGEKLIYPQRMEEFKKLVKIRATDLYKGWDVEQALDIMEALEEGTPIPYLVHDFENAGHTGLSATATRGYVMRYSKNGEEFFRATARRELDPEEEEFVARIKEENEKFEEELAEPVRH